VCPDDLLQPGALQKLFHWTVAKCETCPTRHIIDKSFRQCIFFGHHGVIPEEFIQGVALFGLFLPPNIIYLGYAVNCGSYATVNGEKSLIDDCGDRQVVE